jgi:mannose-6-phosphate isomerase-like protein (cupin superfamily)
MAMLIKNFFETAGELQISHDGEGLIDHVYLFREGDFDTKLQFILTIDIPAGGSVGYHQHGENEEVYVILEGRGLMTVNNEERNVKPGDVILNKSGWSHGIKNTTNDTLKILVFEVNM